MCWGLVLYNVIAVILNTFYTSRLFHYGWYKQTKDYLPFLLAAAFMMCCVIITINQINSDWMQLIVGIFEGVAIYAIISLLFFKNQIKEIKSLVKK